MFSLSFSLFNLVGLAAVAHAHTAGWGPGMFCKGGSDTSVDDPNTNLAVNPIYMETFENMWFQHDRGCDKAPPPVGEFLELPAGQNVTLELAHNRAQTTLSYGGEYAGEWPDGQVHPEDWNGNAYPPECCIQDDGAMHTSNQSTAAGTALAISYVSEIEDVTIDNLVVFSIAPRTPWKRITEYEIPAAMPPCPEGGCICAWVWVPFGCGIQNIYMHGYRCNVTGSTSTTPVAPAKAPVYCADDQSACVPGAKQIIVWHQLTGNNIDPPNSAIPGYNEKCGWGPGAQNDIFASLDTSTTSTVTSSPTTVPTAVDSGVSPSSIPAATASSNGATATSGTCQTKLRRRHPRALGRWAESFAETLESYDI